MKMSDIIPLINEGKTTKDIASHFNVSVPTIDRWKARLKENGFNFTPKKGRPFLKL